MAAVTLTPAALDAIYDELPQIRCQQKCQECCSLIIMSRSEWKRIHDAGEQFPPANMETLTCGWLTEEGNCRRHDLRPLICRAWGVTETMPCPFGCEILPANKGYFREHPRRMTEQEAHRFLLRLGSDTLGPLSEATAQQILESIQRQRAARGTKHRDRERGSTNGRQGGRPLVGG